MHDHQKEQLIEYKLSDNPPSNAEIARRMGVTVGAVAGTWDRITGADKRRKGEERPETALPLPKALPQPPASPRPICEAGEDAPPPIERRQRPLYQLGVDEALAVYLSEHEDAPRPQARKLVETILRAYNLVATDAESSRMDYRISDTTKRLAAMEEGDKIILPPQPFQSIRGRMNTVRKTTGEERRWRIESQHDGKILVTRLRPDEPLRDQTKEPKAVELSRMRPGEEKIGVAVKSVRGKGQVCSSTKQMARRLLNDPHAAWTFTSTKEGVLIKRTR